MIIIDAQYFADLDSDDNAGIKATINGTIVSVPLDPANSHYAEILKQVADGTITIAEAD